MKKQYLLFVLILVLVSPFYSFGQDNPVIKVEVIEDNNANTSDRSKSNHILKLNPLAFVRGDLPLYYENNFSSNLSIEAGVGITTKDYLRTSLSDSELNNYNFDITEEIQIGYSFRVGLRYYSANYGLDPEGVYFGLNFRHQTYASNLKEVDNIPAMKEELKSINNDVFMSLGYVYMIDENAFIDPYIGIGIRARTYDEVNSSGSSYTISEQSDVVPLLILGCKIAISL